MHPLMHTRYGGTRKRADAVPSFPFLLLPQTQLQFRTHGVRQPDAFVAEEVKPSVFDAPKPTAPPSAAVTGTQTVASPARSGSVAGGTGVFIPSYNVPPPYTSTPRRLDVFGGGGSTSSAFGSVGSPHPPPGSVDGGASTASRRSPGPGTIGGGLPRKLPPGHARLSPITVVKETPPGSIAVTSGDGSQTYVSTHPGALIAGVTAHHGHGHEGIGANGPLGPSASVGSVRSVRERGSGLSAASPTGSSMYAAAAGDATPAGARFSAIGRTSASMASVTTSSAHAQSAQRNAYSPDLNGGGSISSLDGMTPAGVTASGIMTFEVHSPGVDPSAHHRSVATIGSRTPGVMMMGSPSPGPEFYDAQPSLDGYGHGSSMENGSSLHGAQDNAEPYVDGPATVEGTTAGDAPAVVEASPRPALAFMHAMTPSDYSSIKRSQLTYHADKLAEKKRQRQESLREEARALRFATALMRVQKWWREYAARWKAWHNRPRTAPLAVREDAATTIQRAWNERRTDKLRPYARIRFQEIVKSVASFLSERTAKKRMDLVRLARAATTIQAAFRGFLARRVVRALKRHVEKRSKAHDTVVKIQSAWRMHALRKLYKQLQLLGLAATQVQRMWRGYASRRRTARLRELALLAPEKRAAFLLLEAERKHASYQGYLKQMLALQTQTRTLQNRVAAHSRVVDRLRGARDRAAKECEEVKKAHAWLEHFADNKRRLEKVALLMHEDVRFAEREFRGKMETNHRWFAEAFGDASLGLGHRISMTQLLASVFSRVARKIDSRTAVASISRTLALDLRIALAEHAPEVTRAENKLAAAEREMEGLDEELDVARRAIEERQAEMARQSRSLRAMEQEMGRTLEEVKTSDDAANERFGLPMPFKEVAALDDAPSIRAAARAHLVAKATAEARSRALLALPGAPTPLTLTDGMSPFNLTPAASRRMTVDNEGEPPLALNTIVGDNRSAADSLTTTRKSPPKRAIPPQVELAAQRVERQMAAFMKGMMLPGVATLSAVRAHRMHQVALVEAEVTSASEAADLLGPLRKGGPLAGDLGLAANIRIDIHRKVGEKFLSMKADEDSRRETEAAWRKGAAPPKLALRNISALPVQTQMRRERNFSKLIRAAAWAGIAPKEVADVVTNSGARLPGRDSEAGSLRGQGSESGLLIGPRQGAPGLEGDDADPQYRTGPEGGQNGLLSPDADALMAAQAKASARLAVGGLNEEIDYVQPLGMSLPVPDDSLALVATKHTAIGDLSVSSLMLELEPDVAARVKARRYAAAKRAAAGLPPETAGNSRSPSPQRKFLQGPPPVGIGSLPGSRVGTASAFGQLSLTDGSRPLALADGSLHAEGPRDAEGLGRPSLMTLPSMMMTSMSLVSEHPSAATTTPAAARLRRHSSGRGGMNESTPPGSDGSHKPHHDTGADDDSSFVSPGGGVPTDVSFNGSTVATGFNSVIPGLRSGSALGVPSNLGSDGATDAASHAPTVGRGGATPQARGGANVALASRGSVSQWTDVDTSVAYSPSRPVTAEHARLARVVGGIRAADNAPAQNDAFHGDNDAGGNDVPIIVTGTFRNLPERDRAALAEAAEAAGGASLTDGSRPLMELEDDRGREPQSLHMSFPTTKRTVGPNRVQQATHQFMEHSGLASATGGGALARAINPLLPPGIDSQADAAAEAEARQAKYAGALVVAPQGAIIQRAAHQAGDMALTMAAGGMDDGAAAAFATQAAAKKTAAVPAFVKMMLKAMPAEGRTVNPMRSVARDFRGHFSNLLDSKVAEAMPRNEEIMSQIPQRTIDPPAEYVPPHIAAMEAEAERLPFMGPEEAQKAVDDDAMRTAEIHAFPPDVLRYTPEDVAWWVAKIGLTKYRLLFSDAGIDGETLVQMNKQDFISVLGIDDYHHINTILTERELLMRESASASLRKMADPLDHEKKMARLKDRMPSRAPPNDAVFALVKAGRTAAVLDAIRYGFDVETEDHEGNTAFIIAALNGHKRMLDLLLARGANMNHQNNEGNCALHYVMDPGTRRLADPDGSIAKWLIMHGAHAELRNCYGLEPYQGLRPGTSLGRLRAGRSPASPPGTARGSARTPRSASGHPTSARSRSPGRSAGLTPSNGGLDSARLPASTTGGFAFHDASSSGGAGSGVGVLSFLTGGRAAASQPSITSHDSITSLDGRGGGSIESVSSAHAAPPPVASTARRGSVVGGSAASAASPANGGARRGSVAGVPESQTARRGSIAGSLAAGMTGARRGSVASVAPADGDGAAGGAGTAAPKNRRGSYTVRIAGSLVAEINEDGTGGSALTRAYMGAMRAGAVISGLRNVANEVDTSGEKELYGGMPQLPPIRSGGAAPAGGAGKRTGH